MKSHTNEMFFPADRPAAGSDCGARGLCHRGATQRREHHSPARRDGCRRGSLRSAALILCGNQRLRAGGLLYSDVLGPGHYGLQDPQRPPRTAHVRNTADRHNAEGSRVLPEDASQLARPLQSLARTPAPAAIAPSTADRPDSLSGHRQRAVGHRCRE